MTPLTQNDPRLSREPSIKPYGCLFRALGELAEHKAGRTMSADNIIAMYRWLLDNDAILDEPDKRAWIVDHTKTIRAAQHYLGVKQTGEYVYRNDMDSSDNDFGSRDKANYFICYARISNASIGHFIHCDQNAQRVWDSYFPATEILEITSLRGYRL